MRTHPFQVESIGSLCALGPFLLVLGQSTALYSLLRPCFKMASDRAKWSNYVGSCLSSTQGVNTKPFYEGIQVLVPGHQVWTASKTFCGVVFKTNFQTFLSK